VTRPARSRRSTSAWWWFLIALAVQLVVLYVPRAPSEGGDYHLDKLVHVAVFGAVVWTGRRAGLPWRWVVLLSALHAPLSEWAQSALLPHRDGSVTDALADLVGVATGAVAPLGRSARATADDRERMAS
jgi:VanZ family protein